ncbi:universal stress protein [Phototrophicus methaneseepsis]|uniref:Universal stress protein n=1 Tax=Phototrophicus methaneseepsis TaxID=2710758 RepID=A0A7S8E8F9_9CHLR|nr:universal stress protein [Phototrophicus methaneseepsis]QPC82193.1 universal stress protein [Phototrophicus methaneseepsis]
MVQNSRYHKIVVPIDGSGWSERAIPHAADIARNNDAEIILLHVFRTPAAEYTDQIALGGGDAQIQQMREEFKQKMISLRNQLRAQGVKARNQFIEGAGVASLICDYINDEGVDLVVMSSHGRSGISRFIFGSVAQKVMQEVSVPVMIVRPDRETN